MEITDFNMSYKVGNVFNNTLNAYGTGNDILNTESFLSDADLENGTVENFTYPAAEIPVKNIGRPLIWKIANALDIYGVPVIIVLGILGNTASFLVFVLSHLKTLSSSVYLAALAVSDAGFLICVFFLWLINVNVNIYHTLGWCQTVVYLTYVFGFLSVWYVVCFTVERYIAVCFPFKRGKMCTTRRAKIVVVAMAMFAMLAYSFALWTSDIIPFPGVGSYCLPKFQYHSLVFIVNTIDSVITLLIPSVTIIAINIRIIFVVTHADRQAKQLLGPTASLESGISRLGRCNSVMSAHSLSRRTSQNSQMTRMLLVVSTMFLLLNLPSHSFTVHKFLTTIIHPDYRPSKYYKVWQLLFQFLYYLNFGINFLLYNMCGENFRNALRKLLRSAAHHIRTKHRKFCDFIGRTCCCRSRDFRDVWVSSPSLELQISGPLEDKERSTEQTGLTQPVRDTNVLLR